MPANMYNNICAILARVVELVDTLALGASAARREGEKCQWHFARQSTLQNLF